MNSLTIKAEMRHIIANAVNVAAAAAADSSPVDRVGSSPYNSVNKVQ